MWCLPTARASMRPSCGVCTTTSPMMTHTAYMRGVHHTAYTCTTLPTRAPQLVELWDTLPTRCIMRQTAYTLNYETNCLHVKTLFSCMTSPPLLPLLSSPYLHSDSTRPRKKQLFFLPFSSLSLCLSCLFLMGLRWDLDGT